MEEVYHKRWRGARKNNDESLTPIPFDVTG